MAKFARSIQIEFSAGDHINTKADVIVVGKIGADCQNGRADLWIRQLSEAKKKFKIIILDYTDHHLGSITSSMGIFYKKTLPLMDQAIVPSTRMLKLFSPFSKQKVAVIEDPIEVQTIPPKTPAVTDLLTLLWFGHATNIPFLVSYLQNYFLCDTQFRLLVLSNRPGLEILATHQQHMRSSIKFDLAEWSLPSMMSASKASHGCLIPSDLNDSRKSGASSNRLITAFALGLPVSADLLESYAPFSDYFHNIRETPLSVFSQQLALYSKCVKLAQGTVVPSFSEDAIAKKWKDFFLTTM